jgi:hypothetical protein
MKQGFLLLITIFTVVTVESFGQKGLLLIDSMYINSIETFYNNAQKGTNDIWKSMTLAPVCLYREDGPALLYNHPNPPALSQKYQKNYT